MSNFALVKLGTNTRNLASFAVDEHNQKENALLVFATLVKAEEKKSEDGSSQLLLTLKAFDADKLNTYEAKLVSKSLENSQELQEFKLVGDF